MNTGLNDHQRNLIELLGEIFIPADDLDDGLGGIGFSGIIDVRNIYQPWMAKLYDVGLRNIEEVSQTWFGKSFLDLDEKERNEILQALASSTPPGSLWTEYETASDFLTNLHMDACFVYCTSKDVWERIGFPGASFQSGGYPDFAGPQT